MTIGNDLHLFNLCGTERHGITKTEDISTALPNPFVLIKKSCESNEDRRANITHGSCKSHYRNTGSRTLP